MNTKTSNGRNMNRNKAKTRMRYDEVEGMGVVTLILFIAIIIVATVAVFVLIIPASTMQKQVEHTGDIIFSPRGYYTRFKVLNVAGDRDNPNDAAGSTTRIEILEIKLGLLAGSPATNLSEAIIEITDGTLDVTLTFVDTTAGEYNVSASDTQFAVEPLRDMAPVNTSTSYAIMTAGDVAKLFIGFNAIGLNMYTATQCSIKLIPKHGVPTLVTFSAPVVYSGRYVELY